MGWSACYLNKICQLILATYPMYRLSKTLSIL